MEAPADFKFDVRIRARLLAKQTLAEAEVAKHLEALPDRQANVDVVALPQPALVSQESRPVLRPIEGRPAVPSIGPRSIPPVPLPVDEGWGEEEDDEDDAPAGEADDDEDDDDEGDNETGDDEAGEADAKAEAPAGKEADKDEAPAGKEADKDEAPADEEADKDEAPADEEADKDEAPADEGGPKGAEEE